jgi:hypothetical protein
MQAVCGQEIPMELFHSEGVINITTTMQTDCVEE